jgi:hypothetical protein
MVAAEVEVGRGCTGKDAIEGCRGASIIACFSIQLFNCHG